MGSLCGWCGFGFDLGGKTPQQTMNKMLKGCGSPLGAITNSVCDVATGLAASSGHYAFSFTEQNGIKAALVGSPRWQEKKLATIADDHNPATALITAYREHGHKLLAQLYGPFALAVVSDNSALIAVDRIGIHALSYALKNGVFIFSTSTASVASHPQIDRAIDPQAIFNYFYFHDIPSPGTVYSGVQKLLPAQYVQFRNGHIEKGFYWQLRYNDHGLRSFATEKQRFFEIIRASMNLISRDGDTAAFLSGGTDSSTVTGIFAETTSGPVDTYSIGFSAEEFDEMEYARLAAERFGTTTHEYYLQPEDIVETIPLIANAYDEPFGNDSAVPTYFCAKRAAEDGVRILLAGDGGDEIFGGNARYAKQMVFEHYSRLPSTLRRYFIEPLAFGFPRGEALLPIRKLRSYIRQAKVPLPERMESYNFLHRHPLEEIFNSDFLSSVDTQIPDSLLRDAYFRADSGHPVNRMMHMDLKFTLADNDLRKVSRMCELAGIEVRYPMLDETLVEFSAELPVHFKVKGQKLRWFFKEALKDFLPKEIIKKSKHGFGLPFGVWSLSHPPLKELVDDTLSRFMDRGYMKPEYILALRRSHAEEHPTYFGKMIWVMVILEQWFEAHDY